MFGFTILYSWRIGFNHHSAKLWDIAGSNGYVLLLWKSFSRAVVKEFSHHVSIN